MNTEVILNLADRIEFEDRFDLHGWGPTDGSLLHDCATVGCVAGWQNAIMGRRLLHDVTSAAKDLGLTWSQADELFTPNALSVWGHPNPYAATAVEAAKTLREIALGLRTFKCDEAGAETPQGD